VDAELCEIAGWGPVPVSVIEQLAAGSNTFLVGPLTKSQQVVGAYHHRRRPTGHQQSALDFVQPTCQASACPARAGLQYDHREDRPRPGPPGSGAAVPPADPGAIRSPRNPLFRRVRALTSIATTHPPARRLPRRTGDPANQQSGDRQPRTGSQRGRGRGARPQVGGVLALAVTVCAAGVYAAGATAGSSDLHEACSIPRMLRRPGPVPGYGRCPQSERLR